MAKKIHQPPAKIKYDKTHPIISIRVDQDLKKMLDDIKKVSGKSVGDILREAVGVQKKSTKKAYDLGFTKAKWTYAVPYKCSICGGTILITTDTAKKGAAKSMHESGWKHTSCG